MAEEPIAGEKPFDAEERVIIRKWMRILEERLEPSDVIEIQKVAQSGKVMRGVAVFIAWFFGAIGGALLVFNAVKQALGKGG